MEMVTAVMEEKYACRLVADGVGGIRVFGDPTHTITLGRATSVSSALKMLDAYDTQLVRRQKIAELVDKSHAEAAQRLRGNNVH